jgi:chromosome segregation ATPase
MWLDERAVGAVDEILKQILSEVQGLSKRMDKLENKVTNIEGNISGLKEDVSGIKGDISGLKENVSGIKDDVAGIKGQQQENSGFIQALLHRTEELDAKFDGILHATASKTALARIDDKFDRMAADMTFLVRKAAEHEDDIRNLKLIK